MKQRCLNPRTSARSSASMPKKPGRRSGRDPAKTVHILRLSGIYGPGRNPLVNLAAGKARRLNKPGQVFNRIHAEDIARACAALIAYEGAERRLERDG